MAFNWAFTVHWFASFGDADRRLTEQGRNGMVTTSPCVDCGLPSTYIELVAWRELPAKWEQWPGTVRAVQDLPTTRARTVVSSYS